MDEVLNPSYISVLTNEIDGKTKYIIKGDPKSPDKGLERLILEFAENPSQVEIEYKPNGPDQPFIPIYDLVLRRSETSESIDPRLEEVLTEEKAAKLLRKNYQRHIPFEFTIKGQDYLCEVDMEKDGSLAPSASFYQLEQIFTPKSLIKKATDIKAYDYPQIYESLGINLDDCGYVMLDVEPFEVTKYIENGADDLYISEDPESYSKGAVAEETAHVTLMFGLLENANNWKAEIQEVLKDWNIKQVEIEEVGFFETQEANAIVAHVKKTDELEEGNNRLKLLPHINTFPEYKPHITLAYVKKDVDVKKWVNTLNPIFSGKSMAIKPDINYGTKKNFVFYIDKAIGSPDYAEHCFIDRVKAMDVASAGDTLHEEKVPKPKKPKKQVGKYTYHQKTKIEDTTGKTKEVHILRLEDNGKVTSYLIYSDEDTALGLSDLLDAKIKSLNFKSIGDTDPRWLNVEKTYTNDNNTQKYAILDSGNYEVLDEIGYASVIKLNGKLNAEYIIIEEKIGLHKYNNNDKGE